jgi:hypothetical protein
MIRRALPGVAREPYVPPARVDVNTRAMWWGRDGAVPVGAAHHLGVVVESHTHPVEARLERLGEGPGVVDRSVAEVPALDACHVRPAHVREQVDLLAVGGLREPPPVRRRRRVVPGERRRKVGDRRARPLRGVAEVGRHGRHVGPGPLQAIELRRRLEERPLQRVGLGRAYVRRHALPIKHPEAMRPRVRPQRAALDTVAQRPEGRNLEALRSPRPPEGTDRGPAAPVEGDGPAGSTATSSSAADTHARSPPPSEALTRSVWAFNPSTSSDSARGHSPR